MEDWHAPAESLYHCIDSHGEEDGKVSLLELVTALYEGVEAGVIPVEAVNSFGENVDMTGLMKGHMDDKELANCDLSGDGALMAGELGECTEKHIGELVEKEDWQGLDQLMNRLHGVQISKEDAAHGLELTLGGIEGLKREDWAKELQDVANACWAAHYEDMDWTMPAEALYDCIDLHGDGDG